MTPSTKEYQASRRRAIELKQYLFLGFLLLIGFIGLLWFARPKESVLEKRELTEFPSLELSSVCDGSFFQAVDLWYSDTYPLREPLIGMNFAMQRLYGFQGEQIINGGGKADDIPSGTVDLEALAGKNSTEAPANTGSADAAPAGTQASGDSGAETAAPTETEPDGHGGADYNGSLEKNKDGIYLANGTGYGVYYFTESTSARYCLLVNQLAKNLEGKAQLYSLLCPISTGVMLAEERQKDIGASDENEAIQWFYRNMAPSVKTVSVFNTLRAHNDEYIFFRTDHHWTALGAYYAYQEWCKVKGVEPHALSDFETRSFEGFLGSFYSHTSQDAAMAANPDTVIAYVPKGTNAMKMYVEQSDGVYQEFDWSIINDVSDYVKSELYGTFAGGDQPFNSVHNEAVTDGSSVLVVKDSFADAFIPFLIDHYEYIYWIDFRSYKKWCAWAGQPDPSISALVARKNIQDVILCQNVQIVGSDDAVDVMESIFK